MYFLDLLIEHRNKIEKKFNIFIPILIVLKSTNIKLGKFDNSQEVKLKKD